MRIQFSPHSIERIRERNIKQNDIERFILFPDKLEVSKTHKNRFIVKKIYYSRERSKDHLLMIICEKEGNTIKIVTIIDTSKISKYF